jgi:DNA-binding MarR family transcriptional regulator
MDPLELSSSLRTAVSTMHKMLRNQSSSISEYSMTERETIGHLIRNPFLLPTDLANLTKVKTQSMSHILNKLEEQGVIKRTPSKDDKRKVYISITPAGKKIVEKVRYEWDEWLKGIIEKSLSEKEKEILIKALPVLNKLIEAKKV